MQLENINWKHCLLETCKVYSIHNKFIGNIHLKLERKNVIWKQPDEIDNTIGFETII